MSAFTDAFLFYGLFSSGGGTAVDPYDVRAGVDNGDGDLGTLASPATSDVRQGVLYGGDGNQYRGTLLAPAAPSTNRFVRDWERLYRDQTATLGEAILATVQGYCITCPAIISEVDLDEIYISGGLAEAGGWNIQIRLSDLSGDPPKTTRVTCNGEATGHTLEVLSFKRNNGIGYLTVIDFAAATK